MIAPSAGAVVVISFPFSDLSASKLRPAVVLPWAGRDDLIPCQVTSNEYADSNAVRRRATSLDNQEPLQARLEHATMLPWNHKWTS